MFGRISTKLAVLYAGLFGVILLLASLAVSTAISRNAASQVRDELQASGTVFDRTWALRSQQLQDSAGLLARDFGFRAAVATGDAATARSALQFLGSRLCIDLAFIVGVDGKVTTADGRSLGLAIEPIRRALDAEDGASGVLILDGVPYQAVSAPILSPVLAGWVVFAQRLDDHEMIALERLAAIPLEAAVFDRRPEGQWVGATTRIDDREAGALSRFIAGAVAAPKQEPRELSLRSGEAIALVKPLHVMDDATPAVLVLRYPLAKAMAPFQSLFDALYLMGAVGIVLVAVGSFMLAAGLARPIAALDEAARRLKNGEMVTVPVNSRDELGRLAESFNSMAAEIRDREEKMRRDAETLAVALDRAEAANRTTNAFLANMSHEVRTPLNGVLGLSQVLARTTKDPAQIELVAAVINSAEALERLLSDILDAASLGAGQTEVRAEPFPLGAAVRAAGTTWAKPAADKGLVFAIDIDPAADQTVTGDPQRLRQVLDNLLSNAIKFTATGAVRLSLVRQGSPERPRFRFEVADSGVGFDPAMKERLFQPFQQADTSSTRRYGGTGLGLSISRGLAELMGGTLDGAPQAEGGSVFVLELPMAIVVAAARDEPPLKASA